MFWNDIAEIKEWMYGITERLVRVDHNIESIVGVSQQNNSCTDRLGRDIAEVVKDSLIDIIDSEDEFNSINRIHDKLNSLLGDIDREKRVLLAEKTLDKFEDYMKNVEKLNAMINEFKGCAGETLEHRAHYKIDAIYKVLCESGEKKPRKKRKHTKKKRVLPSFEDLVRV